MSDRNGFSSGFWLGTLVGGVVGGIVGSVIVSANNQRDEEQMDKDLLPDRSQKRPLKSSRLRTTDRMEMARQSLDDKISDLNNAIDAVRSSVSNVSNEKIDTLIDRSTTNNESPSADPD